MPPIPKNIFQVAKTCDYNVFYSNLQKIRAVAPEFYYTYTFFDDEAIYTYFDRNPLPEFPNIKQVFQNIKVGAHKSDLFRYYYLYIEGGVYIDSDGMIYQPLDQYLDNFDFISVFSINSETVFQGFIAATPGNQIIYHALKNAYDLFSVKSDVDYFIITRDLYYVLQNREISGKYKILMFHESADMDGIAPTFDENGYSLFLHYFKQKIVPDVLPWKHVSECPVPKPIVVRYENNLYYHVF